MTLDHEGWFGFYWLRKYFFDFWRHRRFSNFQFRFWNCEIDTKIQPIVHYIHQYLNPEFQVRNSIFSLNSSDKRYSQITLYVLLLRWKQNYGYWNLVAFVKRLIFGKQGIRTWSYSFNERYRSKQQWNIYFHKPFEMIQQINMKFQYITHLQIK